MMSENLLAVACLKAAPFDYYLKAALNIFISALDQMTANAKGSACWANPQRTPPSL